jgi:hypothetical protein
MSLDVDYSDEANRIAIAIGQEPFHWEQSGYPEPTAHWKHLWDDGCAICKVGYAPWALRLVIDRILALHENATPDSSAQVPAIGSAPSSAVEPDGTPTEGDAR